MKRGDKTSLSKMPVEEVNKAKRYLFNAKILPLIKQNCGINFVERKRRTKRSTSGTLTDNGFIERENIEHIQYIWFGIKKPEWDVLSLCICFEFESLDTEKYEPFGYFSGGISYTDQDRSCDMLIEFDDSPGDYDDYTICAKYDKKTKKFIQIPPPPKEPPRPKSRYRKIRDFVESRRKKNIDETEYRYDLWLVKSHLNGISTVESKGENSFFIFMLNHTDQFCKALNKCIARYSKILQDATQHFGKNEQ